ncbi:auxin-responsive protein IAA1 [Euphorbia lathyris]|uniref:auxin-responsive protein IAA1 n=1 Tax=Euphorbia lathyris TaxID=212925 RepID=UPI0033139C02
MSPPPESDTELTLALPGDSRVSQEIRTKTAGTKRGFLETVDLSLGSSGVENGDGNEISSAAKPPPPKAQVVGWPPVRGGGIQKERERCKYVKVAVDGAPYLRKVDVEMYSSYEQLLNALEKLFRFGVEYVPTFQDKDGDWMMLGDVPWKMFVESCKRLRLMKSSDAASGCAGAGAGARTCSTCSS